MLFNSWQFLVFFPIVTIVAMLLGQPWRQRFLLLASYFFYGSWKPEYLILILWATAVNYALALAMAGRASETARRSFLALGVTATLAPLVLFKYLDFLIESFNEALAALHAGSGFGLLGLILPVGISFFTFQALGYLVDVYRRRQEPEPSFVAFSLYITYFPQLVAGPIERSDRLLPQLKTCPAYDHKRASSGAALMAWGFFKKVVVADRLAPYVTMVYANPGDFGPFHAVAATYLFAYQIYCDFSGYSDIAVGASRVMGIDLMRNFDSPYQSRTIPEFWRRWHISLSTWFRDYLYIPLGGSRVSAARHYLNLFVVFTVSGLWHGANWTFVFWGAAHGLMMVASQVRSRLSARLGLGRVWAKIPTVTAGFQVLVTFNLVVAAWVFFRAASLTDALTIFDCYGQVLRGLAQGDLWSLAQPAPKLWLAPLFLLVAALEAAQYMGRRFDLARRIAQGPTVLRWAAYATLAALVLALGVYGGKPTEFVYFQF